MATHQLSEAEKVADQIIVLSKGQVAFVESRTGARTRLTEARLLDLMKSLDARSEPA
jgi:ABC-type multidrug transport system ATPase subunit